ncbi:hypothetical protein AC622_12485 [Bacillus sp. FJAT-27916]|nr:hypothetical protein AC622_12485 [Bacillus sp. FJAT-27916]
MMTNKRIVILLLSFIGLYLLLSPLVNVIRDRYLAQEVYEVEEGQISSSAENQQSGKNDNKNKITEPPYEDGDIIGQLIIHKLGLEIPIVEGVLQKDLQNAVGHLVETAYPNEGGNIVIAGFRTTDSGPLFNKLTRLEVKDQVEIIDFQQTYIYEVTNICIIDKDEQEDLLDEINEQLALVTSTCDGAGRIVVIANKEER